MENACFVRFCRDSIEELERQQAKEQFRGSYEINSARIKNFKRWLSQMGVKVNA